MYVNFEFLNAMAKKLKLSVIIPCKNEEENIRQCIKSVIDISEEVIVADSGSTDKTMQIAKELGCRIIEREYRFSGDFKNWAIPQACQDWVLILDADERLPEELNDEIRKILAAPKSDGYWIFRRNYFMGHLIRFSGWQNDRVLRLFRRDLGRYVGDTDHAEVEVSTGNVSSLNNKLIHYSYWSYDQCIVKMNRYSAFQAERWNDHGKKVRFVNLLFRAPFRFLQTYILRLGFLDGWAGIQVCGLIAMQSYFKQVRLWEMQCGKSRAEIDTLN